MPVKHALFLVLALFTSVYLVVLVRGLARTVRRRRAAGELATLWPSPRMLATGFVTCFFDTFGIGSFATTTALFKVWRLVPDEWLPGTLNVGHTLPAVASAFVFIQLVPVDPLTLVAMIGAAVTGAWLGAGVVAGWPRQRVRWGMGTALLVACALMLMTQLKLLPSGGDALALSGARLAVAVLINALLGALMTLGIGLYAPCMILVSLLGMNPTAAFPIMMGSCAFLMPIGSARFVRRGSFHPRATLGLALGGVPALLIAAFVVKSLPVGAVRWLVIAVVLYTATRLLAAAGAERRARPAGLTPSGADAAPGW